MDTKIMLVIVAIVALLAGYLTSKLRKPRNKRG